MNRPLRSLLLCGALGGALGACSDLRGLLKPDDLRTADEHFRLGAAAEAKDDLDDAVRHYARTVGLHPSDPEAWLALGNAAFKRGDLARAEDAYRRALNIAPEHVGAQNNLAMAYLAQNKNLTEAEALAKAALRQEGPLRPYVLDTLASIYEAELRFPEARAAAAKAAAAKTSYSAAFPLPPESL